MKKLYITPAIDDLTLMADSLLTTASQGVISGSHDIDYGGIDKDGTMVPGARGNHGVWDDGELE